jgi:hypothetical protein
MSIPRLNINVVLDLKVVPVPPCPTRLLVMSRTTAPITVEIGMDIEHAIHLEILHVTLDLAFGCHIPDNLVHPLYGIPIGMRILGLAKKMVVNFFVDIFRVFAPANKVVALRELEDVDVGH